MAPVIDLGKPRLIGPTDVELTPTSGAVVTVTEAGSADVLQTHYEFDAADGSLLEWESAEEREAEEHFRFMSLKNLSSSWDDDDEPEDSKL